MQLCRSLIRLRHRLSASPIWQSYVSRQNVSKLLPLAVFSRCCLIARFDGYWELSFGSAGVCLLLVLHWLLQNACHAVVSGSEEFEISCDIDVAPVQNSLKRIGEIRLVPLPPSAIPTSSQPEPTIQNAAAAKSGSVLLKQIISRQKNSAISQTIAVQDLLGSPSASLSNASPRPSLNGKSFHKSPLPSPAVQPVCELVRRCPRNRCASDVA